MAEQEPACGCCKYWKRGPDVGSSVQGLADIYGMAGLCRHEAFIAEHGGGGTVSWYSCSHFQRRNESDEDCV